MQTNTEEKQLYLIVCGTARDHQMRSQTIYCDKAFALNAFKNWHTEFPEQFPDWILKSVGVYRFREKEQDFVKVGSLV